VDVKSLGVGLAVGPWLDVARAEERGDREAGDGAAALPKLQESVAKQALSDALNDETLSLCRLRKRGDLLLEGVKELVRQRLRELERPS
jgi:hypothetical protein